MLSVGYIIPLMEETFNKAVVINILDNNSLCGINSKSWINFFTMRIKAEKNTRAIQGNGLYAQFVDEAVK